MSRLDDDELMRVRPWSAKRLWASFTEEQRLEMAKACPNVAGPWREGDYCLQVEGQPGCAPHWVRGGNFDCVAETYQHEWEWHVIVFSKSVGARLTRLEAMALADEHLLRSGWVLDGKAAA